MAKAKRKPQSIPYDMGNPREAMDYKLVKAAGWATDRKYPRAQIDALEAMPIEQVRKAGISMTTTRRMLEGSEERTVESTAAMRSDIPDSFIGLGGLLCEAVSDYQAVWNAARPSETVSLSSRMSGGSISNDPYDQKKLETWSRARRQMNGKEARVIETYLLADGGPMSHAQFFLAKSGAAKLSEYFGTNSIE